MVQLALDLPFFFLLAEDKSERIGDLNQSSRVRGGVKESIYRNIVISRSSCLNLKTTNTGILSNKFVKMLQI